MKKTANTAVLIAGLSAAMLLSGCSAKEKTAESPEGTITGYLVENADKYVKLGDYKGLSVEEVCYKVTDDDVDLEIDNRLYSDATLDEVDRASEFGDTLTIDFTATGDGLDPITQEDYTIEIGMSDISAEFDEALIGRKKGDTFDTEVTFDEASADPELVGQTLKFNVTVKSVYTTSIPTLDDSYVKEHSDLSTTEEYTAAVRQELEETYESEGKSMALESLMTDAIDASTFNGYPDAIYDVIAEQVKGTYQQFADSMGLTLDELYEYYEMSEDDLESEILTSVNRRLFVSALCEKENLALTDETYNEIISKYAEENDFDDVSEYEAEYGKNALVWYAYDTIVSEFLYKNANVTKTVNDYTADDLGVDFLDAVEGETALEIDGLGE